ncbi:hypothetical protein [Lysinibacter sp. HNR]|nr:hypothetical protein [Lysinibacter sp. HNR]WGD37184.1 hypothetical protein FrondiHNR_12230 [Lysinibacter sp. HNR]
MFQGAGADVLRSMSMLTAPALHREASEALDQVEQDVLAEIQR